MTRTITQTLLAGLLIALALPVIGCDGKGTSVAQTGSAGTLDVMFDPVIAEGTFEHGAESLRFVTEVHESAIETRIEMRGLVLQLTVDTVGAVVTTDGYAAKNGDDTQLLDADVALLEAFETQLTDTYLTHKDDSEALDHLIRALTIWSGYTVSMPLRRTFEGRVDRSASLCGHVNKPGQGVHVKKWIAATHDCNHCHWFFGCSRWDARSTTPYVFMSMHPAGSCADDTYFGSTAHNFSCYEANHDANADHAYGQCFGRCGGGCGAGTQFTRACLDHDQCVRSGHSTASFWCLDEFEQTGIDVVFAPHCGGHMTVDYNWAGKGQEGQCPTSWNGTNDGCDVGCQFIDGDCFR